MRKMIAALLALSLSVCLFGCGKESDGRNESVNAPNAEPEETVTLYLLTEEADYFADGSQGFFHKTYTYTNAGLPLTVWEDWGTVEQIWDEKEQVYLNQETAYDGNVDHSQSYAYDSEGSLIGGEDGLSYSYQYDGQGRPVSCYAQGAYTLYYRYNEAGLLRAVERSSGGVDILQAEFEYDEEGRLVKSRGYGEDALWEYGYRYGENGELLGMTYGTVSPELADSQIPVERFTEFEYDEEGKLISRKQYDSNGDPAASVLCTYTTAGKISSICYFLADGNLDDPFTYQHSSDGQTVCVWTHKDDTVTRLTYDKDGNLIRRDDSDGSYTLYKYQAIEVTAAQAQKAQQAAYLLGETDADGEHSPLLGFSPDRGFDMLLPLPQVALHETDLLRN